MFLSFISWHLATDDMIMTDVSMHIAKINVREYIVYPSLIAVLRIFWICHLLFVCLLVTEAYFDSLCGVCDAKVG